jgi:hypothetical protein
VLEFRQNDKQGVYNGQQETEMQIVHVHVHVKPEFVEAFKQATIENARNSVRNRNASFDVIQQTEDQPSSF